MTAVFHQVDNHLSDGVYPVLVSKREEEEASSLDGSRRGGGSGRGGRDALPQQTPFLQISIIKEVNQSTNTAHYDYVAFRCDGLVVVGNMVVASVNAQRTRESQKYRGEALGGLFGDRTEASPED